jgi:hypothetical protein
MKSVTVLAILMFVLAWVTTSTTAANFPDAHESPPVGWTGHVFKLSQDYPATVPAPEKYPWLAIDFRAQPAKYIGTVYQYVLEGNVDVDWDIQNNPVRKWYHAPWMHIGDHGREFVRGLTRERTTPRPAAGQVGELGPGQTACAQNWAVGFFNPAGGFVVGQVWANPNSPDASKARFPEGTVIAKLLFTSASLAQLPYLAGSLEWTADISEIPSTDLDCRAQMPRSVQTVRLLQMDLAVRDSRANTTTGWVFATYAFDGSLPGTTPWQKMSPVGVMWGNDPTLTSVSFASGQRPQETWRNPDVRTPQHLGWLERLNGPVDNPSSSCLSCHATAQTPAVSPLIPPLSMPEAQRMRWFQNYLAGQSFDAGSTSTDYSLQLAFGIQNFRAEHQSTLKLLQLKITPPKGEILINGVTEYVISRGN